MREYQIGPPRAKLAVVNVVAAGRRALTLSEHSSRRSVWSGPPSIQGDARPRRIIYRFFTSAPARGACVEEFVRLVHPVQLRQAWRLLLPECGRGKRRRTERIGDNSQ